MHDFKKALTELNKSYQSSNMNRDRPENNKILITENDFSRLSAFEKGTIRSIARIHNLISDRSDSIDFKTLLDILNRLGENKSSSEKAYYTALFFPEKIRNLHIVNPFPIPTYTFIQRSTTYLTPNSSGNFALQAVCPYLADNTQLQSNLWQNTNNSMTGLSSDSNFVPILQTQVVAGAFNAYVLHCLKISIKYVGRPDVQSGVFGGAYFLSYQNSSAADNQGAIFNYIDDSINSVKVDSTDGINIVYYPPDTSYTEFRAVNKDLVASGAMSTSVRLAAYGCALPNPVLNSAPSIQVNYIAIWNIIPSVLYAELLPVDYNIAESNFDLISNSKIVPHSGLNVYKNSDVPKIERMLELPSPMIEQAIAASSQTVGKESRKTVLDHLGDSVNDSPPRVEVDKRLIASIASN
jgi:hypothetical protein